MSDTYSKAAVHAVVDKLMEIICEQDEELRVLTKSRDHSCEVIDRQVAALLNLAEDRKSVASSDIRDAFLLDPADE